MERGGGLITILVAILLFVSLLWLYDYFYGPNPRISSPPPPPPLPSYVQSTQNVKVLIIDMNADQRPEINEVFGGEDAMLLIHQSDDPFNHENDNVYANDVLLKVFDKNKDGRIDAHDSMYRRLELKYFDKSRTGIYGFMPITQAGIRAIYIDPRYYSKFGSRDLSPRPIGTAIMADGTARLIRQVLVNDAVLNPGQTITPGTPPATTSIPRSPNLAPSAVTPRPVPSVQPTVPAQ